MSEAKPEDAIARVRSYLAERGDGLSVGKNHIHGYYNAPLLCSDLCAIIAAAESKCAHPFRLVAQQDIGSDNWKCSTCGHVNHGTAQARPL